MGKASVHVQVYTEAYIYKGPVTWMWAISWGSCCKEKTCTTSPACHKPHAAGEHEINCLFFFWKSAMLFTEKQGCRKLKALTHKHTHSTWKHMTKG